MTVVLITSTNRYIGDTADTKPTGKPAGSTFFDRQTGILYICYDGTNWVEKPSEDTLATLIGEVQASPTANTVLDRLKDLATLLNGGLPAALAAGGGLKVEGVAGGVTVPVSGGLTDGELRATPVPVKPKAYATWATGELAGAAAATVMPAIACEVVKFKAAWSNAGNVYIGIAGVTKPDGTTDATTGLELAPGEETPWLDVANLNVFYRICDNAGDDLTYIAKVS